MRQYWVAPLPPFHTADGTAVTAASLTDASPAPPIVIPGNLMEPGSRLEFTGYGRYTSTGTPGTIIGGVYMAAPATAIGSAVAVCVTAALTVQASQTNRTWRVEGSAQFRTIGTAGTLMGCCEWSNITSNGTDMSPATAPATATLDTTAAFSVRIGLTPSVATGSWTVHHWGVRLVT